jgi:(p)ppGpp synthase/HD superfamily hydrolase
MSLMSRALEWSERAHAGQTRKDGIASYLVHPLAVASLVLRFGGSQEQAAAALLHDTLGLSGISLDSIRAEFGEKVAALVDAFVDPQLPSDIPAEILAKYPWETAKKAYLAKLQSLDAEALLVIGCEEFHELTELASELRSAPPAEVWKRRPAHPMNYGWYYKEILKVITAKLASGPSRILVAEYALELRQLQGRVFEGA